MGTAWGRVGSDAQGGARVGQACAPCEGSSRARPQERLGGRLLVEGLITEGTKRLGWRQLAGDKVVTVELKLRCPCSASAVLAAALKKPPRPTL